MHQTPLDGGKAVVCSQGEQRFQIVSHMAQSPSRRRHRYAGAVALPASLSSARQAGCAIFLQTKRTQRLCTNFRTRCKDLRARAVVAHPRAIPNYFLFGGHAGKRLACRSPPTKSTSGLVVLSDRRRTILACSSSRR